MKATQSAGGLGRLLPIMSASLILLLSSLLSCNGNSTGPTPQPPPEGWVFMGLAGKRIERVRLFGDYLYACAHVDGLWRIRTDSDGKQWQFLELADSSLPRPFTDGVNDVVVIGDTVLVGYATTSGLESGILRAAKGDTAWKSIQDTLGGIILIQPALDDNSLVLAASQIGEVYKSNDRGLTWELIYASIIATQFHALLYHSLPSHEIWLAGDQSDLAELVHSKDNGDTWEILHDVIRNIQFHQWGDSTYFPQTLSALSIAPQRDAMFLASDWLWKSVDGGETWDEVLRTFVCTVSINPNNSQELVIGGPAIFRSVDGGVTWVPIDLPVSGSAAKFIDVDWQNRIIYTNLFEKGNIKNQFGVYNFYLP